MENNLFIFVNINSWHTVYTIASKTGTYFVKKHDILQSNGYVNTFKGAQ